jgi:hypothetical protein
LRICRRAFLLHSSDVQPPGSSIEAPPPVPFPLRTLS